MPGSLGNLGGVSYDIIAEDKTQAGVNSSVAGLAKVTAAFASVAAAGALVNKSTDAYDKLSQTSVLTSAKLGISITEMNDAVKSAAEANSDFVSDASEGFDLLARSGEANLGQIAEDYAVFSEIAKVAGTSTTTTIAQIVPALKAFGLEVSDAAKYEDVFTSVTRDTTLSLGEFTGFISRSALNLKALKLDITDTAAIFELLADKGIQGRQAMRVFSQAMQDQSDAIKYGEQAAKDYAEAQEELRIAQDKSAASAQEYAIRMGAAGRDVASARRLTMERRIDLLREQEDENKAYDKMAEAQTRIDSAKSNEFDVYKALGVTQEEVQGKKDLIASNTGLTERLADGIVSYETATQKQAQWMEQLSLSAGQLLDPIKDVAASVKTLSAGLAVVGTGATILKALGALGGGGALAGGAGGIAGGLGKAAAAGGLGGASAGSAGAFAASVPQGAVAEMALWGEAAAMEGSLGAGEAGMLAGGGAVPTAGAAGTSLSALALPALAGLLLGGGVTLAAEKLGLLGLTGKGAVRSAGEAYMGTDVAKAAYQSGKDVADTTKVITIGTVKLSRDYDFQAFMKDMDTYMHIKRTQRGIPT